MAITTAFPTSLKSDLFGAKQDFTASTGNNFKMALFKPSVAGTFGAATVSYGQMGSDETNGTGYTAGGSALTKNGIATSGTTAYVDFADVSWTTATISTEGCLIYNISSTASGNAAYVGSFGGTQQVTSGTLTVQFPAADASNAILRIA